MDTDTPAYHRQWIERIDQTIAAFEKVRQDHETKLAAALAREQEEENHDGMEL